MSLAQDLLRRAGIIESPPRPVLVRQEPVKKPTITPEPVKKPVIATEPTPAAPVKRASKHLMCNMHMARVPGVVRMPGCWKAIFVASRVPLTLGLFHTMQRALVARKLYMHWLSKGYGHDEIPRYPAAKYKR